MLTPPRTLFFWPFRCHPDPIAGRSTAKFFLYSAPFAVTLVRTIVLPCLTLFPSSGGESYGRLWYPYCYDFTLFTLIALACPHIKCTCVIFPIFFKVTVAPRHSFPRLWQHKSFNYLKSFYVQDRSCALAFRLAFWFYRLQKPKHCREKYNNIIP